MELLQLLISGVAQGCVYGLIALGFVLIYKATEIVNFAQGDIMMLGAFAAFSFIGIVGLPYWAGFLLAIVCMALFGYMLDWLILRRVIGQPQFAIVILTIALGFIFRAVAGGIWGHEPLSFLTPFTNKILHLGTAIIAMENLAIIVGTAILSTLLFVFFRFTKVGVAMQAASQNQLAAYYMGIPVKVIFSLIWGISAAVATVAGVLLSPISLVDTQMGFIGIKAFAAAVIGGFGSLPGAVLGGLIIGGSEQLAGAYLPNGFKEIAAFLIMLIVLTLRPQGLFAQIQRKKV